MSPSRLRSAAALFATCVACSSSLAQISNDLCANAPLIGIGAVEGTTIGAAANGSASCGLSNAAPDVYYRFMAPATCQFEVVTCDGNTNYDTVVSIHSACPATASNQITCNNDGCGTSGFSRAVFSGTKGTTYTIRVAGASGQSGDFTLIVRQLGRPSNDTCAFATPITGVTGTITGDTTCAMSEGWQTCGEGNTSGSPNLFYLWTAPFSGVVSFDTCDSNSFDTYLSASTACPHLGLNIVGCNNNFCGRGSYMQFGIVQGATYIIRVGGNNGESGTFQLDWSATQHVLPNDNCLEAQRISLGSVRGTTINATVNNQISCLPTTTGDVFYRFSSPVEAFVTIDTCSLETNFDTTISIHSSCPARDDNRIACNDNDPSGCLANASVTFPAQPGVEYIVRVAGVNGVGNFVLNAKAEVDAIVFDPSTLGEYYLLRDGQNMASFRASAEALGADMTALTTFSEAQFVNKSVMQFGNVVRSAAIGLSDMLTEGAFEWDTGENLTFTLFGAGQPDNTNAAEDYVHIYEPIGGLWNDYPDGAYQGLFGIAESDRELMWWTQNPANDHLYLLFKPTSWQGAEARARAMGSHLVSIGDAAENEFVRKSFGWLAGSRDIWLGLNDRATEGFFVWSDGSPNTFGNFMTGEPNNFGGNEDYVEMQVSSGLWNDIPNLQAGNINHGVVEMVLPHVIATARGPGGCGNYALLSASSYYPSEFGAWWLGGYVVAISSAEENEFIRSAFAQSGGGRRIWLGASDLDEEGSFRWSNYETFFYSNFAPGEPNSAGGNEDYIVMNPDGKWSDVSTLDAGPFYAVVEFYCVCDWDASGSYNSQDFFDFLTEFFANRADVNCDGATTSQDFFDFLTCFFNQCD